MKAGKLVAETYSSVAIANSSILLSTSGSVGGGKVCDTLTERFNNLWKAEDSAIIKKKTNIGLLQKIRLVKFFDFGDKHFIYFNMLRNMWQAAFVIAINFSLPNLSKEYW